MLQHLTAVTFTTIAWHFDVEAWHWTDPQQSYVTTYRRANIWYSKQSTSCTYPNQYSCQMWTQWAQTAVKPIHATQKKIKLRLKALVATEWWFAWVRIKILSTQTTDQPKFLGHLIRKAIREHSWANINFVIKKQSKFHIIWAKTSLTLQVSSVEQRQQRRYLFLAVKYRHWHTIWKTSYLMEFIVWFRFAGEFRRFKCDRWRSGLARKFIGWNLSWNIVMGFAAFSANCGGFKPRCAIQIAMESWIDWAAGANEKSIQVGCRSCEIAQFASQHNYGERRSKYFQFCF